MLTDRAEAPAPATPKLTPKLTPELAPKLTPKLTPKRRRLRRVLRRAMRIEWAGQTAASLCWIASVFAYGITSRGDWLQLCAASAWLLANTAALVMAKGD
ncbi:MAG: hypothetical protein OXI39_03630 [Gemmatimonadota bacterium]|uniref:hypothetical protein n=1 Tax=Candidatus Palauibacter scopulicola TaxID=3056741 RepID=UPI002390C940|nr:hypothetical protein [Candidatus Palauibacter scopulicola]MDE2662083.1 hypothetical protein [Candidatus Palauibacter scopulicola]